MLRAFSLSTLHLVTKSLGPQVSYLEFQSLDRRGTAPKQLAL